GKEKEQVPGMAALDDLKTETKYSLANSVFTRTTKYLSKPKVKEEDMPMFQMMFGTGKITTIVHLPKNKKVKEAKLGGGTLVSKDNGKVVVEYPMMDYLLGKTTNDLTIVME
ncbi:MAG TPA: hypothetical protein VG737_11525, partial [Cyclobacteriaceae bacterium]|nr:hypothetical protein [Cyclobacteriaceae bacterium]